MRCKSCNREMRENRNREIKKKREKWKRMREGERARKGVGDREREIKAGREDRKRLNARRASWPTEVPGTRPRAQPRETRGHPVSGNFLFLFPPLRTPTIRRGAATSGLNCASHYILTASRRSPATGRSGTSAEEPSRILINLR